MLKTTIKEDRKCYLVSEMGSELLFPQGVLSTGQSHRKLRKESQVRTA